jgi:hypothetical protein
MVDNKHLVNALVPDFRDFFYAVNQNKSSFQTFLVDDKQRLLGISAYPFIA